jgi:UDP-N-acetylglucosamine 2-epimerase (non-hydrolysing)
MQVLHVVGARPNFVKAAAVLQALARAGVTQKLVHTGQHYDAEMTDIFFRQLSLPEPDMNLQVGSASHARQTGEIMIRLEPVVLEYKPDWVVVYGDVNSTLAATLTCAKLGITVAHVEAGLRSFDRTMPEEINRITADQLADLLFTPSQDGNDNLAREGIAPKKVHLVGNVMIDTLIRLLSCPEAAVPAHLPRHYALVTLHRPSNVDQPGSLLPIVDLLVWLSGCMEVFFPLHPRTRRKWQEMGIDLRNDVGQRVHLLDTLPYLQFLGFQRGATVVLTDSGGVQEETTFLGVPCLTVRENTERPITVSMGTNLLIGHDWTLARTELQKIIAGHSKRGCIPPLWDGQASQRIAEILLLQKGKPAAGTGGSAPV